MEEYLKITHFRNGMLQICPSNILSVSNAFESTDIYKIAYRCIIQTLNMCTDWSILMKPSILPSASMMAANARQPFATSFGTKQCRQIPSSSNSQQLSELISFTLSSIFIATSYINNVRTFPQCVEISNSNTSLSSVNHRECMYFFYHVSA